MKLLIFGHWSHTGFGIVTQRLGEEFLARGIDVRILAVNHRGEPVKGPLAGRIWPANMFGDGFGGNLSGPAIDGSLWTTLDRTDEWKPDQVLVISDMSGLQGHVKRVSDPWLSVPVWHYCPIEGDNLPIGWKHIWDNPSEGKVPGTFFRPVAMSEFGRRIIAGHLGHNVPMIYHGVDTDTFRPVSPTEPIRFEGKRIGTKEQAKAAFGIAPDAKVILRYDRLVPRKFYHLFLKAMAGVLAAEPKALVLIHCRPQDEGLNLVEEIVSCLPAEMWSRVKLTQAHDTWTGLPTEGLVALINAADVYVSTTSGEGFGLTLAESLACGVPVVVTDWAAEREVVGPGGILVPPLHDSYGEVVRYHSTYGMDWAVPDARAFTQPVLDLLAKPQRAKALGDAGRRHVRQSFSWSAAADEFTALFDSVTIKGLPNAVSDAAA